LPRSIIICINSISEGDARAPSDLPAADPGTHSNLADDAQFVLGIFYLEELHQPAQAYSEFLKVDSFPRG
jgi:hypothetical protein